MHRLNTEKCRETRVLKCFLQKEAKCRDGAVCLQKCLQPCMKNQLVKKLHSQVWGFLGTATDIQSSQVDIRFSVTTPVNIRCHQDTLWMHFHHPYIRHPFDAARLCIPLCFSALKIYRNKLNNYLSTHAQRILFPMWPVANHSNLPAKQNI